MKVLRYTTEGSGMNWAVLSKDETTVRPVHGDLFGALELTGDEISLADVMLAAPLDPPNIFAIGLNYRAHADEGGAEYPEEPVIFIKATTSVIAPEDRIVLPHMAPDYVDYEAELAVVIGKTCRNVGPDDALDYVFGYTCANDVSARDCQRVRDRQWARAKSFDTFCPLGPWIETELDPLNVGVSSRLNGETMQDSNTNDLIFPVPELISFLSQNFTLIPGTVILTGTPSGVGFARTPPVYLGRGDRIEITLEGIGTLGNDVVSD
jgi:2-keto-4-pentenoate hydratase/2-oxohepta-3-ene-1,7-dioic acid hydratase in catechol pathway